VFSVRAMEGINDQILRAVAKVFGENPLGGRYCLKDIRTKDLEIFRNGELSLIPDKLYTVFVRKFPKMTCRMIEKLLKINFVYIIGFTYQKQDLGALYILSETNHEIEKNNELIKNVMHHSSAIISKILAERMFRETNIKLRKILDGTIDTLSSIVEMRDPYTAGHQKRVAEIAVLISEKMHVHYKTVSQISIAALIHDIGKISIPASILSKPGKLNEIEYKLIKTHPQTGYEILKNISFDPLIPKIILQHHERLDGSGYPFGLKSNEITFEAKILTLSDVIEAMLSHRPYRPAFSIQETIAYIEKHSGKLFDPHITKASIQILKTESSLLHAV
jgi:putative nucleotidyltransferase with HDIG domain